VLARNGARLVRRDAVWQEVEPAPPDPLTGRHTYDWTRLDLFVWALARHGIRWLPIIDYSAKWAAAVPGDPFTPPANTADYVAYATAVARRYGRAGSFWSAHPWLPHLPVTRYEVWNEPNSHRFWRPQGGAPERYAELYAATRAGIRSADPYARVIVGGLALGNQGVLSEHEFVDRMYRHRPDLRGNVDAFALHPYAPTVEAIHARIKGFRDTLMRHGAGAVPLEITEVGWTTSSDSESHRAAALAGLAYELPRSDCGIRSVLPYTWLGAERDPSNPEHWFGIANPDGSLKPSGSAYLDAVGSVTRNGAGAPIRICGPPAVRLRLRGSRRFRRVKMVARCSGGCLLRLAVVRRTRRGSVVRGRTLARRSARLGSRRRVMTVRMPVGRHSLALRALATGHYGARTTGVRRFRARCYRHRRRCAVRPLSRARR
jgi:polysaccharide biosynthesis protein PslG